MSNLAPNRSRSANWLSWHIHVPADANHADRLTPLIATPLADLIAGLREARRVHHWFFIRYWEGGPHLRLRILPTSSDDAAALDTAVRAAFRDLPQDNHAPEAYLQSIHDLAQASIRSDPTVDPYLATRVREPGVHHAVYTPETERYGAGAALSASEAAFTISSDVAASCAREGLTGVRLRVLGLEVICKAAHRALPHEPHRWLQRYADFWRSWASSSGHKVFPADALAAQAADWATTLRDRGGVTADRLIQRTSTLTPWDAALRTVLETVPDGTEASVRQASLCISHSHMTLNRLGLLVHDEFALIETARHFFPTSPSRKPARD